MGEAINVSSKSSTKEVTTAIQERLQENDVAILKAIGAGAVNQAVKGIVVASTNEENKGLKITISFFDTVIDGVSKSGLRFEVKREENV